MPTPIRGLYIRISTGDYVRVTPKGIIEHSLIKFEENRYLAESEIRVKANFKDFNEHIGIPLASILEVIQSSKTTLIDITRMTQNISITAAIFGEATDILRVIGEETGNVIGTVGHAISEIFGSIASGGASIIHEAAGGLKTVVEPITSTFSGIFSILNEIIQWLAITVIAGYNIKPRWLTRSRKKPEDNESIYKAYKETRM